MRMLWAWESPQDLRFLEPDTGVAFLAGELHLEAPGTRWQPRRNPLRVNPGTWLMAVIRVECALDHVPGEADRLEFLRRALALQGLPGVRGVQVDFDARLSERPWYRKALRELRTQLSSRMPLSITALASWCWEDPWIKDLPVDEAVPMLFRMGPAAGDIRRRLEDGVPIRVEAAQHCLGLSTDEGLPRIPRGRRVYAFHPGSWGRQNWALFRSQL